MDLKLIVESSFAVFVEHGLSDLRMSDGYVFGHPCLRMIFNNREQHQVSGFEVRQRVFGHSGDTSTGVTVLKHWLRWLRHVLRKSSQWMSHRSLFAGARIGWKKLRWLVHNMVSWYGRIVYGWFLWILHNVLVGVLTMVQYSGLRCYQKWLRMQATDNPSITLFLVSS